jgi:ribulose-phosphate 3-epimerase
MKNVQLAPSILSADFLNLKVQIKELEQAGIEVLHLDVMDGHFVPNLTFGPMLVKEIRKATSMILDCHLMVTNPDELIPQFAKAGADVITVHQEAPIHLHRTVQSIRSLGIKAGVSLNPATHENTLDYVLNELDLILVMSVNPGFGGQSFISDVKRKISNIKKKIESVNPDVIIEVDGGVKQDNAKELLDLGADWLVAGSAVFGAESIARGVSNIVETF